MIDECRANVFFEKLKPIIPAQAGHETTESDNDRQEDPHPAILLDDRFHSTTSRSRWDDVVLNRWIAVESSFAIPRWSVAPNDGSLSGVRL